MKKDLGSITRSASRALMWERWQKGESLHQIARLFDRSKSIDIVSIGLGRGLGSVLRWWIGRVVGDRYHGDLPLGTFLINVSAP